MQSSVSQHDINIRSSRFYLARAVGTCRRCGAPTRLFALAVPPGHETLELDDEAQDDEAQQETLAKDTWRIAPNSAFLFFVEFIPAVIQNRLKPVTQLSRFGKSEAMAGGCWANHCERCGSQFDDQELFCEPEGAFFPTSEMAAGAIQLLPIDEAFEAAAAGYAYEPQFFDAMSKE
jgi:hypothetical protein